MDILLINPRERSSNKIDTGARKLLICEGGDDARFLRALLCHLDITDVQTGDYGGNTKLGKALNALSRVPNARQIQALGVTADADGINPQASQEMFLDMFRMVRGALSDHAYPAPDRPGDFAEGEGPVVFANAPLRVGIFIMPDNESHGMMETLCLKTVENDPVMECVDVYFDCARRKGNRQPDEGKEDKARALVWLASQAKPNLYPGRAAEEGYWKFDSPALDRLKQFLRQL